MDITDGDWLLFEHDPETGRTIWMMTDENGDTVFRIDTPVDHLIKANAEAYSQAEGKRFGEWARIASVPFDLERSSGLAEAHAQGDQKFISRWLNDGDNRAFRTRPGNV